MPGCIVSATTASFKSVEKRRRRATPVITSTFENVSDIGVCLVDRIYRVGPASDGGDNFVGVCGPDEGFGIIVGFAEEAVDGGLEVDDRAEHAPFEAALGQFGEEALDGVEPGG